MLSIGLTGGLGSGKSTVAALLRSFGSEVIDADSLGRQFMQPGQPVYEKIARTFGPLSKLPNEQLNRAYLAEQAFQHGRLQELNAIIHPAVIDEQFRWMNAIFQRNPAAITIVESALIFEVERDAIARGESETALSDWRRRFHKIISVIAPEGLRIARYAARIAPQGTLAYEAAMADAQRRIAHQTSDTEKAIRSDYLLKNDGNLDELRTQVMDLWPKLIAERNIFHPKMSLQ